MVTYTDVQGLMEQYIKQEGTVGGIRWILCALSNIVAKLDDSDSKEVEKDNDTTT